MPKYISGRVRTTPVTGLTSDRYRYLSLADAEPNLGDPLVGPSSIGAKPITSGNKYQLFAVDGYPGERYWQQVQSQNLVPGSISVYEEGSLIGGLSSTTELDFRGTAITAEGLGGVNPGYAVTITFAPPGNEKEVIFKESSDFATDSTFTFDSSINLLAAGDRITVGTGGTVITTTSSGFVGIGTTNPTGDLTTTYDPNLHVEGNIRLTGTIIDRLGDAGQAGYLLVKEEDAFGGLSWTAPEDLGFSGGGDYRQVQYKGSTGLLEGGDLFYYDEVNNFVGIGSTQPNVRLDVMGTSNFDGDVTIEQNLTVTQLATFNGNIDANGNLDVDGQTDLDVLNVSQLATFSANLDINASVDIQNNLDVGSTLNVVGIATLASAGGITTTGGDLYVGGDLYADGDFATDTFTARIGTFTESLTAASLTLDNPGIAVTAILDEDDMISNRDDALATQQSIKAYIDGLSNVATADSLTNARQITATGDIDWSVSFKGHEDVSGIATLATVNSDVGTFGSETQIPVITVDEKGRITGVGLSDVDGGAGGSSTFLGLTDTPGTFTASKYLAVNSGGTAIEFVDAITLTDLSVTTGSASGGGSLSYDNTSGTFTFIPADINNLTFLGLTDTPSTFTASKYLAVNSGGTAVEFVDAPSGSGSTGIEILNSGSSVGTGITVINFNTDLTATVSGTTAIVNSTASGSGADKVSTGTTTVSGDYFLTFVDSNNDPRSPEYLYTDAEIKYDPGTDTLKPKNLTVGNTSSDALIVNASVGSTIAPDTTDYYDLGSSASLRWKTVYADTICADNYCGAVITGSADTVSTGQTTGSGTYYATFVQNNHSVSGAASTVFTDEGLVYDPDSNTLTPTNLTVTNCLTVDQNSCFNSVSSGTITPNADSTYDLGATANRFSTIYADTLDATNIIGSISGSADQVKTQCTTSNTTYYLTFVDSNNASATAETLYTNGVTWNPSGGKFNIDGYLQFENSSNIKIGDDITGCSLTTGNENTLIGGAAGRFLTTGGSNTYVGAYAGGASNCSSIRNTFLGYAAGCKSGDSATYCFSDFNIIAGYYAGCCFSGCFNTVIGNISAELACGYNTIILGTCAAGQGQHFENVIIGCGAGGDVTQSPGGGIRNIFIGCRAGYSNNSTNNNTFIGRGAGYDATTGENNIAIGRQAGNSTMFDFGSIGATCANQIILGNESHTRACVAVAWSVISDIRHKCVWGSVPHGREFLRGVNPIKYSFKDEDTNDIIDDTVRYGFSAQEILALEGDTPVIASNDVNQDSYGLTTDYIIPVLVNAIKELDTENTELRQRIVAIEQHLGL